MALQEQKSSGSDQVGQNQNQAPQRRGRVPYQDLMTKKLIESQNMGFPCPGSIGFQTQKSTTSDMRAFVLENGEKMPTDVFIALAASSLTDDNKRPQLIADNHPELCYETRTRGTRTFKVGFHINLEKDGRTVRCFPIPKAVLVIGIMCISKHFPDYICNTPEGQFKAGCFIAMLKRFTDKPETAVKTIAGRAQLGDLNVVPRESIGAAKIHARSTFTKNAITEKAAKAAFIDGADYRIIKAAEAAKKNGVATWTAPEPAKKKPTKPAEPATEAKPSSKSDDSGSDSGLDDLDT